MIKSLKKNKKTWYNQVPNYYTFDNNEIDFIIQDSNDIIPIKVKSGDSKKHKSLTSYNNKYSPKVSIRISMDNLSKDGNILNIPLFLLDRIDDFIKIIN